MNKKGKSILIYVLVLGALLIGFMFMMNMIKPTGETINYSEVVDYFQQNKVKKFVIDLGSGELQAEVEGRDKQLVYKVPNVGLFIELVEPMVVEYNKENPSDKIEFNYLPIQDNSWLLNFLPTLLLIGVMVVFWVIILRQQGGGKINQFGKMNAKNGLTQGKKATFADVAGADEEKAELVEIVEFLKNPKKFNELGARIPKGVLLMGPPGTGKTLLARAVAGEAGVPFFSISGSDFVEMFVGVGASRVRDLFEQAKKNAPAIIFIDEIDAVGRHRGAGLGGGHDEREQTLNQLLVIRTLRAVKQF